MASLGACGGRNSNTSARPERLQRPWRRTTSDWEESSDEANEKRSDAVLAAVTRGVGQMEALDVPEPSPPGPGEVIVSPDAVGICGSDFHFFSGELQIFEDSPYPRIQGHEFTGMIDQLGPDTSGRVGVGDRVSILPISNCGECYPCRVGRGN